MIIIQAAAIGLTATVLMLLLRQTQPSLALILSLTTGVILFFIVLDQLTPLLTLLRDLASRASIDDYYIETVLKIIGIAYITEFAAQASRDADEETIAGRVELVGKVIILVMAVPIISAILDLVLGMLS